jgi:ABC-type enterobactin transport system permease subunit
VVGQIRRRLALALAFLVLLFLNSICFMKYLKSLFSGQKPLCHAAMAMAIVATSASVKVAHVLLTRRLERSTQGWRRR